MTTNFAKIAADSVSWWRANDGGLTHAAMDIIGLGHTLDEMFASLEAGEITAQELQQTLWDWQWECRTGTESDLVGEALDYLNRHYMNEDNRQ
jgi:hypothetical protein